MPRRRYLRIFRRMDTTAFSYQFYSITSAAWDAMYQALLSARKSIYWEIYIFQDDPVGEKFVTALAEQAARGVEVKLIIDAFGSFNFSRRSEARLRQAGVEVLRYNRLFPGLRIGKWISRLLHRNHRKVLIIDEQIVFLGGVNIDARFKNWDDVYLKIEGPVTRPLLRAFAKSYVSAGGKRASVEHLLHPKLRQKYPAWRKKLTFITQSSQFKKRSSARQFYLKAIETAKESVNLVSPYYVPNRAFLKALSAARQRGVKVNIFLPLRLDLRIMEWIARAYYTLTLQAGARIYILPKMHHGKAAVVDAKVGFVGSANLNRRSFYFDEESGVQFNDAEMVKELNVLFNRWQQEASPLDEAAFYKRGWVNKVKEWWAKRIEDYL